MRTQHILIWLLIGSVSCSESDEEVAYSEDRTCVTPDGQTGSPETIKEVLDLINALPRPVTVECFIDSLDRPLRMVGSTSIFSAQPAHSDDAPRIFAVTGSLIISWVPDGEGSRLLEFAEERPFARSVKAEVHMPVEGKFAYVDAFDHLLRLDGQSSTCGICHGQETRAEDIDYAVAFESLALRPRELDMVTVQRMRNLHAACDVSETPERCKIYDAMFRGSVEDANFGRALPTFF